MFFLFPVKFISEQLILTAITVILTAIVVRLVRDPHQSCLPHCLQRALAVFAACCCLGNYRNLVSAGDNRSKEEHHQN